MRNAVSHAQKPLTSLTMKTIVLFRALCVVLLCATGFAQSNPAPNATPVTPGPSTAAPSVPPDSTKLKIVKSVKPV
jgi:hypothetical protein